MLSFGVSDSVLLDVVDFLYIIEEFCMILFVLMAAWLVYLGIVHLSRVFSLRRILKSFYTGLSNLGNQAWFTEYVKNNFSRVKHSNRFPLVDLLMRLLEIFQGYRQDKNRPRYLGNIIQLRDHAWDVFSHSSTRAFSLQLSAGIFIFIVLAVGIFLRIRPIFSPVPLVIVALFNLFSLWLYMSREKQSKQAVKEIDKLASIYARYLSAGENELGL